MFLYPKDAVLNLTIEPRDHYIDLEILYKRKSWADFDRKEILSFIEGKMPELRVFDSLNSFHLLCTKEAQDLIDAKQALFFLEDIIAIEEKYFI